MKREFLELVKRIEPCTHTMLIYVNKEEKREILFTFLKAGLDKGEGAIYVTSEETPQQIREAMQDFGIDVDKHEGDGSLKIIDYDGWYIRDGRVVVNDLIRNWKRVHEEMVRGGKTGLRAVGETHCFFEYGFLEELIIYEKNFSKMVLKLPITAISAYRIDDLEVADARFVIDLIMPHKFMVNLRSLPSITKVVTKGEHKEGIP
ncbi:MAG: MEDS domain-containing protein [archaeon]|nr:MEDS domain-containing protein [archaeon]